MRADFVIFAAVVSTNRCTVRAHLILEELYADVLLLCYANQSIIFRGQIKARGISLSATSSPVVIWIWE